MKKTFGILMVLASMNAFGSELPVGLKNACAKNCTPEMKAIHDEFLSLSNGVTIYPAAYSGECYVLSSKKNAPVEENRSTMLFHKNEKGMFKIAVGGSRGGGLPDDSTLSYDELKEDLFHLYYSRGFDTNGTLINAGETVTSRVAYDGFELTSGSWTRQNLKTKEVFEIRYDSTYGSDGWMKAGAPATTFCKLKMNPNGQPTK